MQIRLRMNYYFAPLMPLYEQHLVAYLPATAGFDGEIAEEETDA